MSSIPASPPQSDADDTARPLKKQKRTPLTERLAVRFDALAGVSSEALDAEGERHKPAQRLKQDVASDTPHRQPRSSRVRSCDACRIRKNKCDRGRPCANCTLRRACCTYENAGNDPFSGTRLQQNKADIARLCERVFALARRLGLSERELDELAATADELDEDDSANGSSDSPTSRRQRPLSGLLRDRDTGLRSNTPPVNVQCASPPPSSSTAALPPNSPSPGMSSEHQGTALPHFAYAHVPAFAKYPSNIIFAPFPPSPYQVIHYVPYLAPSSSSLASPHSLSPPQPTFLLRPPTALTASPSLVDAQTPTGFTHPPPLPGWAATTSLASTTSAQRACPVLLPPITIPPTVPSRPTPPSASPCALRSTSTIPTTPSTAASPCPVGGGFGALPAPPRGGYHLPRPKRTAGAPGVGLSLERFASAAGVTTTGRMPCAGALLRNVDALEGFSPALPPLRYPFISAAASDVQKKALGKVDQDAARVKLPRLSQAVSAAFAGGSES